MYNSYSSSPEKPWITMIIIWLVLTICCVFVLDFVGMTWKWKAIMTLGVALGVYIKLGMGLDGRFHK